MKHYINITVNRNDSVFYSIDRMFDSQPHMWVFVQLPVFDPQMITTMLQFIRQQLDKEYNNIGCCWNLVCCFGCLFGSFCGSKKLTPQDVYDDRARAWFCSELVTATLQIGGYGDVFTTEPRYTTPQMLFDNATQIVGSCITEAPRKQSEQKNRRITARPITQPR
jgi:hypothetical protein